MTRVLVVDDHDFFRRCLIDLLGSASDLLPVGECRDGSEVVAAVRALSPDVVLLDVRMPRRSGLEAVQDLSASGLRTRVIFLSAARVARRVATRHPGVVNGLLTKTTDGEQLLRAVRHVAAGGTAFPGDAPA